MTTTPGPLQRRIAQAQAPLARGMQRTPRKDVRQLVYLTGDDHELLSALARRRGISQSAMVRCALHLVKAIDDKAGIR